MATTNFPVNHPSAVKKWSGEVLKEALKKTYAMRFMGTTSNSLCQIKSELKEAGDRITQNLRVQLDGTGVSGDGTLEGNEEALSIYTDQIYIDQLRHAVRSGGKMSEQRVPFTVRDEARDGLADWWANRIDTGFFNQLCGNTAQADTRYTGMQVAIAPTVEVTITSSGTASISATEIMTLSKIDLAVEKAKLLGQSGSDPYRGYPLRPVRIGSEDYFVCFMHESQATDLRTNTATGQWLDIQKAAMSGGEVSKNPIFTGALGVYNGVILHSSSRVPTSGTASAGSAGDAAANRRAVLCGAQALSLAFGKNSGVNRMSWVEELFDYKNQLGVACGMIWGLKKNVYNSLDFGTITITTGTRV